MLSEREFKILNLLADYKGKNSIKHLASQFNLSERSIRYDIDSINDVLREKKLPLIKRMTGGKLLLNEREVIANYLHSIDSFQYTPKIRRKLLLLKIALNGEINLTTISKELDISRSSIKADVEELKNFLDLFNLKLVSNHKRGLLLLGDENDIRRLQLKTLMDYSKKSDVEGVLLDPLIDDFIKDINIGKIEDFIFRIQQEINNIVSDEAYNVLKIYIIISIIRNKSNHFLDTIENKSFLSSTVEFSAINNNKHLLNESFLVSLNKYELLKIADLFLGSHSYNFSQSYYKNWFEMEILVKNLIQDFSNAYGLDLTDDKELIKGLITHIKPTLYRTQNNIKMHSSIYQEVIKAYPKIYEITSKILKELETFNGKSFDRDEISFIAIYFKVSIDRNKYKLKTTKNVLLVCGLGYGTSKLLGQQLKQNFELNILDSIPFHYVDKYVGIDDVDWIITTIKDEFPKINKPILVVNPILTPEDIKALNKNNFPKLKKQMSLSKLVDIINSNSTIEDNNDLIRKIKDNMGDLIIDDLSAKKQGIVELLSLESIKVNAVVSDWKSALKEAGTLLVNSGYTKEGYTQSLINSFETFGSYMIIAEGIAIPHAKNENNVLKTGMALLTLKDELKSPDGRYLKVILAFASIDHTEHLEALSEFSNLITAFNFKDVASEIKSSKDILEFIKTYNNTC